MKLFRLIKELRTIPGLGEYIDDWLVQNELQQYIQSVILDWILSSNGKNKNKIKSNLN